MATDTVTFPPTTTRRILSGQAGMAAALAVVAALALPPAGLPTSAVGTAHAAEAAGALDTANTAAPTVEVAEAGRVTVEAPAGFSNAEVVELALPDGSYAVRTVVADRTVTFYAPQPGSYTVTRTYDDVWSVVDALAERSYFAQTTGRDVLAVQLGDDGRTLTVDSALTYPDEPAADNPIVALAHFVGVGSAPSGSVELDRKTADALVQTYLVVEDRDENTGSLLASVLFTPEADCAPSAAGEGGSQAFNLVVNPSAALLEERLAAHASCTDAAAAQEAAAAIEGLVRESFVAVLANLDTMAAYSTGEKLYTLNLANLLDGAFAPGTELRLAYLGAAGDDGAYVGTLSAVYEEKLQATDVTLTVDEQGFVSFGLYGGGIYVLGLPDAVDEALSTGRAALDQAIPTTPAGASKEAADTAGDTSDTGTNTNIDADAGSDTNTANAGGTASPDATDAFSLGEAASTSIDTHAVQPAPAGPNTVIANTVAGPGWKAWVIPAVVVVLADIVIMALLRRVRCRRCRREHEARIAALTRALSIEQASSGETAEQRVVRTSGAARFAAGSPAPEDRPAGETLERVARLSSNEGDR